MTEETQEDQLCRRRERYNAMCEEEQQEQLVQRRERYNAVVQEVREEQLGQRRERYNSVSQEAWEEQLGQRRLLDILARQQESSEDRDIRLRRREQRQAAPLTSEFDAYSKFREDMQARTQGYAKGVQLLLIIGTQSAGKFFLRLINYSWWVWSINLY